MNKHKKFKKMPNTTESIAESFARSKTGGRRSPVINRHAMTKDEVERLLKKYK